MPTPVAVLDFETTGLSPDHGDRVTEVAVVVVEGGRPAARFQSLMNAGVPIPGFVEHLTGISSAMVRAAPPSREVMRELARFVGDLPLVAHNAAFDRKFLDAELARVGLARTQDVTCSMRVARRVYPDAPDHKLATVAAWAGVPAAGRQHRALADAEMTAGLWIRMQSELMRRHRLPAAPLELMQRLERAPRRGADAVVARYRERLGL